MYKVVCVSLFLLSYSGLGLQGGWVIAIIPSITVKFESAGRQQSHPAPSSLFPYHRQQASQNLISKELRNKCQDCMQLLYICSIKPH